MVNVTIRISFLTQVTQFLSLDNPHLRHIICLRFIWTFQTSFSIVLSSILFPIFLWSFFQMSPFYHILSPFYNILFPSFYNILSPFLSYTVSFVTTYCLLFIAYCLLFIIYCLIYIIYCLLFLLYIVFFVALYCFLFITYCFLLFYNISPYFYHILSLYYHILSPFLPPTALFFPYSFLCFIAFSLFCFPSYMFLPYTFLNIFISPYLICAVIPLYFFLSCFRYLSSFFLGFLPSLCNQLRFILTFLSHVSYFSSDIFFLFIIFWGFHFPIISVLHYFIIFILVASKISIDHY